MEQKCRRDGERKTESNRLEEKIPSPHFKKKKTWSCVKVETVFFIFFITPSVLVKALSVTKRRAPLIPTPKPNLFFFSRLLRMRRKG